MTTTVTCTVRVPGPLTGTKIERAVHRGLEAQYPHRDRARRDFLHQLGRETGAPVDYAHIDGWNYLMLPASAWDAAHATIS